MNHINYNMETNWKENWFNSFLLIVFIVSLILLVLVFIKEGFPLP